MKKILCLLLCVILTAAAFAGCNSANTSSGGEAENTEHTLKVGYGRVDATPSGPMPLSGLHELRFMDEARDPFYVNCVAYTDEKDNTVLVFFLELLFAYSPVVTAKRNVSKETGVPAENIFVCTNHNHNAPALEESGYAVVNEYNKSMKQWMI